MFVSEWIKPFLGSFETVFPNRISPIPEIDDMIFEYLDLIIDFKSITLLNHHYHSVINKHSFYIKLRNFCKQGKFASDFIRACGSGHLDIAKYIYHAYIHTIDIHADDEGAFIQSCGNGHLYVATWLFGLDKNINIHFYEEFVFQVCCHYGHPDVILWLYNLDGNINIHADNDLAFAWGSMYGHLEVIVLLYNIDPNHLFCISTKLFVDVCEANYLDIAIWIYNLILVMTQHIDMKEVLQICNSQKITSDATRWITHLVSSE